MNAFHTLREDIEQSGGLASWLEERFNEAQIILKGHWLMQPRVPAGQSGGGQWAKYGGSGHATAGLKSSEAFIKDQIKNGSPNAQKFYGPKYKAVQQALKKPTPQAALAALNQINDAKNKKLAAYIAEAKQTAQNAINSPGGGSSTPTPGASAVSLPSSAGSAAAAFADIHGKLVSAAGPLGSAMSPNGAYGGFLGSPSGTVHTDMKNMFLAGDATGLLASYQVLTTPGNKFLAGALYNHLAAQKGLNPVPLDQKIAAAAGIAGPPGGAQAAPGGAAAPKAQGAPAKPPTAAPGPANGVPGAGLLATPGAATQNLLSNRSYQSLAAPETVNTSLLIPDGGQQGSNPGGWYKDPVTGERAYIKTAKSEQHARVEVMSNALYAQAGAASPEVRLARTPTGDWLVVSPELTGATPLGSGSAALQGANLDFAAHAWLANRDAIGLNYDNQMRLPSGHVATVDAGGTMMYRAQGGIKPFTAVPDELTGLTNAATNPQAASVFNKDAASVAMRQQSAQRLAQVSDGAIQSIVDYSGLPPAERAALFQTLAQRRDHILASAGLSTPSGITPAVPSAHEAVFQSPSSSGPSSAAASTTAALQAATPIKPGEVVSMFRFVENGYGESPFRADLAAAPRIKPTDFPTAAQFKPSPAEVDAVSDYQGGSSAWHDYYRNGGKNMSETQRAFIEQQSIAMDSFLARSRMPKHGYIVRAINIPHAAGERLLASVGREFVDPGYVGGSHANGSFAGGTAGGQTIRINLPAGAPAAFLYGQAGTGSFKTEGEVLIQRNSRFRIVSASRRQSDGRLQMELDWMGVDPITPKTTP
jgi:hypothetical protein